MTLARNLSDLPNYITATSSNVTVSNNVVVVGDQAIIGQNLGNSSLYFGTQNSLVSSRRWSLDRVVSDGNLNVGSDLRLRAYDNNGNVLGNTVEFTRSTQVVNFPQQPTITNLTISKLRSVYRNTITSGVSGVAVSWAGTPYRKILFYVGGYINVSVATLYLRTLLNGVEEVGSTDYSFGGIYNVSNAGSIGNISTTTASAMRLTGNTLANSLGGTIHGELDMGASGTAVWGTSWGKIINNTPDHETNLLWISRNAAGQRNGLRFLVDAGSFTGDIVIEGIL